MAKETDAIYIFYVYHATHNGEVAVKEWCYMAAAQIIERVFPGCTYKSIKTLPLYTIYS